MKSVDEMSEAELRESDVPWLSTQEELLSYTHALVAREHDYGTCVYAMSMAAVAAYHYVAHALGVTGFQASCADLDILRRTRGLKHGFRIIDYGNLLYPQYLNDEHFPNYIGLITENRRRLAISARELLNASPDASPNVLRHWRWLSSLSPASGRPQ